MVTALFNEVFKNISKLELFDLLCAVSHVFKYSNKMFNRKFYFNEIYVSRECLRIYFWEPKILASFFTKKEFIAAIDK